MKIEVFWLFQAATATFPTIKWTLCRWGMMTIFY